MTQPPVAIIGGTGLASPDSLVRIRREVVRTPYGEPSGPLVHGELAGCEVVFLARHGQAQELAPHAINYRANIWALAGIGVQQIIAVNTVGGIRADMQAGCLAVPAQIVDYTWGREPSFTEPGQVLHTDFTRPYDDPLRALLIEGAAAAGIPCIAGGTYAATQGPRLETAAEIDRLEGDGCDMVGMTGMPEAILARERGMAYACCALISNRAAGRGTTPLHEEIRQHVTSSAVALGKLLEVVLPTL